MNMIDRDATIEEICNRSCGGHCTVDCDEVKAVKSMPFVTDAAAYQRGYEDGFREGRKQAEEHDGCDGCYYDPCGDDEEPCRSCKYCYLSQYRRADDKIRVGDEVEYTAPTKSRFVVFLIDKVDGMTYCGGYNLDNDCQVMDGWNYSQIDDIRKTGRHFPEVEKLLEAMKG